MTSSERLLAALITFAEGEAYCPCCQGVRECLPECTIEADCKRHYERMMAARDALNTAKTKPSCPTKTHIGRTNMENTEHVQATPQAVPRSDTAVGSKTWLAALVAAWSEYQEIDGDFTYHLQEGGDSKYTRLEWMDAWLKFDNMMKEAANDKVSCP